MPVMTYPARRGTCRDSATFTALRHGDHRSLLPYLWPRGDAGAKIRVVAAMALPGRWPRSRLSTCPVIYGRRWMRWHQRTAARCCPCPLALIVAYGGLRVASAGFGELRDAVFASSAAARGAASPRCAHSSHLHALSLRFHLDRQTGALARAIDRGTTGIQSVLRLAVFNVVPTLIELLMVTAIIWHLFNWQFAARNVRCRRQLCRLHHWGLPAGAFALGGR